MHKISPPQLSIRSAGLPSREEFRLTLPQLQDKANQYLRSVTDDWQCRLIDSGVIDMFQTWGGNETVDLSYDANNNTLYLGVSASVVLDLGRHIGVIPDREADRLFKAFAGMNFELTQLQAEVARTLTLGVARLVAPKRWRGL